MAKNREKWAPEVELPITPMLDMFFQMLFFFVMTYHPSALEGQFPINLAATEDRAGQNQPTNPDPKASPRVTPDLPHVTVVAKAADNGWLESVDIFVRGGSSETLKPPPDSTSGSEQILRHLTRRLQEIKKEIGGDDRAVVQASGHLRWEDAMRVMDACRRSSSGPLFPKLELDLVR